ncbi:hypothetical protein [Nonomuraea salmonea]|uniref:hypothetical protein n=1 Tax=Nonomuraea salmonea TaxID=46181 RepID=UPI0031EDC67C
MPATQSTPESVPLVPHEPTISGMPAPAAARSRIRRSRATAAAVVFGVPEPR